MDTSVGTVDDAVWGAPGVISTETKEIERRCVTNNCHERTHGYFKVS